MTTTTAKDRIWGMFRAPETPPIDTQLDEALEILTTSTTAAFDKVFRETFGEVAPCGHSRCCELPHGHAGLHRLGPMEWAGR